MELLKEQSERGTERAPSPSSDDTERSRGKPLLCAHCRRRISDESQRIEIFGTHLHARLNPHGFTFVFGCFARAEGCIAFGPSSSEATWFAGYGWQIASCASCFTHLGWRFTGESTFYGLIVERLVPGEA